MQIRIACFPRLNIKKKTVLNLEFKLSFQSFQLKLFYHLAQIPLLFYWILLEPLSFVKKMTQIF
jgi:hypothetical protein